MKTRPLPFRLNRPAALLLAAILLMAQFARATDQLDVDIYKGVTGSNSYYITYTVTTGTLHSDGSFTNQTNTIYEAYKGDPEQLANYAAYFAWANGKYVWHFSYIPSGDYSWLTFSAHTNEDGGNGVYWVDFKKNATPTPTPTPAPTPVPTPTPPPNIDNRSYGWPGFGFPCDLNWRRLWDSPSSSPGFIDRLAFNLWNRGYPKTADALADDYQLLYSTINGMGVTIKKHRPKSAIKKWKKKLNRLAGEEAGFYQDLVNVKNFLDGSEPLYDIEKPLQQFAGDMNLAFQRARHGKKPVVGSNAWSSPACPSFSSNPLQTLDPGPQEISQPVTITGGAPMRGFSVTFHVAVRAGDGVGFKLISPWNQSWNFIPSSTGMVGGDGLFDFAVTERLQQLAADRDPAGTWRFQVTYTPDNTQPADALVVRQALTFYPASLW